MVDSQPTIKQLLTRVAELAAPTDALPDTAGFLRRRRRARTRVAVGGAVLSILALVAALAVIPRTGRSQPAFVPSPAPTVPAVGAGALAQYHWSTLPTAPIQTRSGAVGMWTGTQLIVWGGETGNHALADGAAYTPATRNWEKLPASPLGARSVATAVWTGQSLFIWGGYGWNANTPMTDGALYTPADRTWKMLPTTPGHTGQDQAQALLVGSLIVLITRAAAATPLVNAQAYDMNTNKWTRLPDLHLRADRPAYIASAVSTGDRIYLWSIWSRKIDVSADSFSEETGVDSFTLDLGKRSWSTNSLVPPAHQSPYGALWTGREVLLPTASTGICGFCTGPRPTNQSGLVIDPATGKTSPIPHGPVSDLNPTYVWTGAALLAANTSTYMGGPTLELPGQAAAWDPASTTWYRLPREPLIADPDSLTVWTGTSLLIWGSCFTISADGKTAPSTITGLQLS